MFGVCLLESKLVSEKPSAPAKFTWLFYFSLGEPISSNLGAYLALYVLTKSKARSASSLVWEVPCLNSDR